MEDAAAFVSLARRIGTPAFSATSSETPTVINRQSMVLAMGDTTETKSIEDISVELAEVKKVFDEKLSAAESVAAAEEIRREYLGKKGPINQVMGYMRLLPNDKKPKLGAVVNEIKSAVEEALFTKMEELKIADIERRMESERIDVTMPGIIDQTTIGHRHPLSMTIEKAVDIFTRLGYDTVTECADSPEIETDYYCFEALNCPKDHPARDMQDTFYLTNDMEYLLRTHTSSVQIRQLQKRKPPLRIVAPGRVYRRDDIDATHSLMFHQVEILALEEKGKLDLGHLKGTVEYFLKNMFGPDIQIRFRGSFFPFTEPSMEVDVFFRGKWLEVLGCGMVDPAVLEMAGIDPEKFSGFAAGFGVERFAMVIHNIKDIREFVKGDLRFLEQFPHFYDDGLETFLAGGEGAKPTDVEELRTEDIPPFIVTSDDQLRELKAKQEEDTAAAANQATEDSKNVEIQKTDEIDISKLDIRVGVIVKAWEHEEADKLFCEEIDIGEEKPRQIASGLRAHYNLDDLTGQRVLVLSNLKERRLVGFPSYGMVLCASVNGKVEFVEPPVGAVIGERVMVEGYDGEPATENQVIKKKMLDVIFPNLKTNQQGIATYNGVPFMTSAGPCRAQTGLANADVA
jgi:phenylalanyl-tRNA synthetase alpha chain